MLSSVFMPGDLAQVTVASAAITPGAWLGFAGGVVIGAIGCAVAILIARQQRKDRRLEKAAERDARARRDAWREDYEEIRRLLDSIESIALILGRDGPLDTAAIANHDVHRYAIRAMQLSGRGPATEIREPLTALAGLLQKLEAAAIPGKDGPAELNTTENVAKNAFDQGRLSPQLDAAVTTMWTALRQAWGGNDTP